MIKSKFVPFVSAPDFENQETILVPFTKRYRVRFKEMKISRIYNVKNLDELHRAMRAIGLQRSCYSARAL
jgi:hypothetical protein